MDLSRSDAVVRFRLVELVEEGDDIVGEMFFCEEAYEEYREVAQTGDDMDSNTSRGKNRQE